MGQRHDERRSEARIRHAIMSSEIVNKVANSGLITFNLEDFYPKGKRCFFDLKDCLYEGLILKEKDFREFVKTHNWAQYKECYVAVDCSADAIIPIWAYMLVSNALAPLTLKVTKGSLEQLESILFEEALAKMDLTKYENERIIIKGCSQKPVPENAYVRLTALLSPIAKSIMYGEACSTVPIYKKK